MVASFCLAAAPRRALLIGGTKVGTETVAAHVDENHHNIPREYFNQKGGGSTGGDNGNGGG
ncbi:hypothetical protein F511_06340 [Dorcoceras hygrometricum]|uniref:Uncharacterized protein n=1 Tax=Dorcoceras hygrometricum TaxID=472368 RepID=A0A2Z7AXH7_9LAMI|nr:hypothetical protein F511_06339 [Dorcoceras hygrometricum]KZV26173.1 hypothetical protein F511_06340 [Dorcoceras hygrometricum]